MQKMSFKDVKKTVESGSGGKFMKLVDGPNKIRIVSEPVQIWKVFDKEDPKNTIVITNPDELKEYAGKKPKMYFAMYVIDRATSEVKIAEFGPSIMGQIGDLQDNPEFAFDQLPPYDMMITRSGAGLETEYTVIGSRNNTILTPEEQAKVLAMPSLEAEYTDGKSNSQSAAPQPLKTDDIPF